MMYYHYMSSCSTNFREKCVGMTEAAKFAVAKLKARNNVDETITVGTEYGAFVCQVFWQRTRVGNVAMLTFRDAKSASRVEDF